ncbi:hypothetical protein RFI_23366, partial [Reticulomyxa filosa]
EEEEEGEEEEEDENEEEGEDDNNDSEENDNEDDEREAEEETKQQTANGNKHSDNDKDEIYDCYLQVVCYMRDMYWKCKLIHADLSEYNMLYANRQIYIIDVSQSVDWSHTNAYKFLAVCSILPFSTNKKKQLMDCRNVNEYFRRQSIGTLTHKELFDFVVKDIGYNYDFYHRNGFASGQELQKKKLVDVDISGSGEATQNTISLPIATDDTLDETHHNSTQTYSFLAKRKAEMIKKRQQMSEKEKEQCEKAEAWMDEELQRFRQLITSRFDEMTDLSVQEHQDDIELEVNLSVMPHNLQEMGEDTFEIKKDELFSEIINRLTLKERKGINTNQDSEEEDFEDDEDDDISESEEEHTDEDKNVPSSHAKKRVTDKKDVKEARKKNKKTVKAENREKTKK